MGNYDNTKAKAAQAAAQNKMQQLADMVIACGSARSGLLPRSLAPSLSLARGRACAPALRTCRMLRKAAGDRGRWRMINDVHDESFAS